MRFQLLLTTFLLFTLASGLVVPPRISERNENEDSLQIRQFIAKDFDDVDGRSIFGLVKGALGAVKGIGKVAKSVVGAVKGVAKGAGSVAKSVASKAGSVAKKAGGAAKKAATATKNVAKKAATKTKGVAKKAATKTKSVASKAGTKTKNAAKKVSTKAKNAGTKVKDAVNPKGPKAKYHVPAGGGKPGQTYTRKDVKTAVKNANAEHQKLKAPGTSNNQKKKSMLKPFGNNNHHVQKPGSPGPNSLPKMKGKGHEYPLRNSAQGPATAKDKGPARVITQENKKGKLKFKGVVAHDQSRKQGDPGYNDHFQIKGGRK